MFKKILPWSILFLSLGSPLWAQPSIQAQLDRDTVTLNDTVRLTIVIKGGSALTSPQIPPRGNFEVVGRSSGNAIEILNGQMGVTNTFEYLLRPTKSGKFSIGPITTQIDGQTFSAGPIQVTVLESEGPGYRRLPEPTPSPLPPGFPPAITPGYPPGPPGTFPSPLPAEPQRQRPDTFVTAEVDNRNPYVGEQILYTFRIYSAVSLDNASLKMPEFKEFISEELIKENKFETTLDGRRYAVNEVRVALFPTKPGKASTGRASVEAMAPVAFRFSPNDPFNDPFFRRAPLSRNMERKSFATDNIEIDVKALPNPPPNFSGLVGEFTLESQLDQERLATGETVHYDVSFHGKGNIREAQFPKITETPYFKVYPGTPKVDEEKSLHGIGGKKTFSYALVANRPGTTQLGPLTTTYFNPKTGTFEELTAPARTLQITGSGTQESLVSAGIGRREGRLPGHVSALGLQPIHGVAEVLTRSMPSAGVLGMWWSLLLLPPGAYLALDLMKRLQRRREALSEDRKRSQAFRKAKHALGQLDWQGEGQAFTEANAILREYLSDAFLIKGGALTPKEVEDLLMARAIPADTIRRMVYLMEQMDSWRYGGAAPGIPQDMQVKNEIVDLLREIEKAI